MPVAFFAYPGKPSLLVPETARPVELAGAADDVMDGLERLADDLGAMGCEPRREAATRPDPGSGDLDIHKIAAAIGHLMPEGCIVSDEAITSGRMLHPYTRGCPHHDWLFGTGGSIGRALPEATGAAVAVPTARCSASPVTASALYTVQALWPAT